MTVVEWVALASMPGIVVVGIGPVLIGAMMGVAWVAALVRPGDLPQAPRGERAHGRRAAA